MYSWFLRHRGLLAIGGGISLFLLFLRVFFIPSTPSSIIPLVAAERRSFTVEVKTVGELEAARSTIIASPIKGDLGKIIELVQDGVTVKTGDLLVRMDPTPFEEKCTQLEVQIKEQEATISALKQALEWEKEQAIHETKMAAHEIETGQMEIEKILHGDGPQEISRLKGAMQKAWLKYDDLNSYSNDLLDLEKEGFLNPTEQKLAKKKLNEEKDAYDVAKMQYESYVEHVFPMAIKKAESALKRAEMKQEEVIKTAHYKVAKASAVLHQAEQILLDVHFALEESRKELASTQLKAPGRGMVVHREDYRSGQRRKPRVGDILVKNQPLMDLPDLSSMLVKVRVREVDLYKIAQGKPASVDVDAYPYLRFRGQVSSIGVLALPDVARASEEKSFEVLILLENADGRLRPGMTARATIHSESVEDALTIPIHAVFQEDRGYYCYVARRGSFEQRKLQPGIANEEWMQVVEGLQEGELVSLLYPFHQDDKADLRCP